MPAHVMRAAHVSPHRPPLRPFQRDGRPLLSRGRRGLVTILALAGLVCAVGQDIPESLEGAAVEDGLAALADLQLIEREAGTLLTAQHANDFRAAARRFCIKLRSDALRYEACQQEALQSFSRRFLPSQAAIQYAGVDEEDRPADEHLSLRQRPPVSFGITRIVYEHLDLLAPLGTCLWFTGLCPPLPHLANKIVDEAPEAYALLRLGSDRSACLARARRHWQACGSVIDAPVSMMWRSNASVSLANADWSDYPAVEGRHPRQDEYYTQVRAHTGGAWKTLHVWVDDSTYLGLGKTGVPAVPSRYISSELYAHNMDKEVYQTAFGPGVCWTPDRLQSHIDEIFDKWERSFVDYFDPEAIRKHNVLSSFTFAGELDAEAIVVAIFEGKQGGYFIELAAFDALAYSNSLALERDYSWSGLCVEANARHWEGLAHRNCTFVFFFPSTEIVRAQYAPYAQLS
jgi:hypothetical protein